MSGFENVREGMVFYEWLTSSKLPNQDHAFGYGCDWPVISGFLERWSEDGGPNLSPKERRFVKDNVLWMKHRNARDLYPSGTGDLDNVLYQEIDMQIFGPEDITCASILLGRLVREESYDAIDNWEEIKIVLRDSCKDRLDLLAKVMFKSGFRTDDRYFKKVLLLSDRFGCDLKKKYVSEPSPSTNDNNNMITSASSSASSSFSDAMEPDQGDD